MASVIGRSSPDLPTTPSAAAFRAECSLTRRHRSAKTRPRTVAPAQPFPRVFWVALGLELLERLAFYGVYVNLAVYLTGTVGISDVENGALLGVFSVVRYWLPVATGALADRLGFKQCLAASFA